MTSGENGPHVPKKVFFTSGAGTHRYRLTSFELALADAGINGFNLVGVSSILPPGCEIVDRNEGARELAEGQIVHAVMSRKDGKAGGERITATVGCAFPEDRSIRGYISEFMAGDEPLERSVAMAEDLAVEMLAASLGVELDLDAEAALKAVVMGDAGYPIDTRHAVRQARCEGDGNWTTVVAAAVFI